MKKQVLIAEMDETLLSNVDCFERINKSLDKRFPRTMKISDEIRAKWERTSILDLDDKFHNCTKCSACGSWITDKRKPDYLAGLSVGEYADEKIYCPECVLFER